MWRIHVHVEASSGKASLVDVPKGDPKIDRIRLARSLAGWLPII